MNELTKSNPVERVSVSQGVLKRINEFITSGELKQGDKLPTIKVLSERMQVGTSSVREALKQ